jgi:F0F1-type ATP synthase alpha subunit
VTDLVMQITEDLREQNAGFASELNSGDIHTVVEAGDGIVHVRGPANIRAQELYFQEL